jgi:flagellar hook-associated protein 3 FlgL
MRIATASAFESTLGNLQRRQQALSDAQQQLTSGKRVQRVSDDPTAAAQAARAMAAETRIDAQRRALDASRGDMQLSESALGDAGSMLQQVRDLVVNAGNAGYSATDRATLVQQLQGLRTDLLAVANRKDANGRFLFSGQGVAPQLSNQAPFTEDAATHVVTYNGVAGQQQSATDQSMPLTVDGNAAWLQTDDPQSPGTPISVFDALQQTIDDLSNGALQDSASVAQSVGRGLSRIDAVSGTLSSWRSYAGLSLNTADQVEAQLSQGKLDAQTQRSSAEDLDMVQALSDFQNKQTGYDAALKTYSMVQRLSLFDYIK